jgi:hypothetical protein
MSKPGVDGGVRGVPNVPTKTAASGRWTVGDVYFYQTIGVWVMSGIKRIQYGYSTALIAGSQTTGNVTIDSVDPDSSFVVLQRQHSTAAPSRETLRARITSPTNLEFTRAVGDVNPVGTGVSWAVVECDAKVNIQKYEGTTTSSPLTITHEPVDVERTLYFCSNTNTVTTNRAGEADLMLEEPLGSTQVRFRSRLTSGTFNYTAYIVEF